MPGQVELLQNHFDSVIRLVRRADITRVGPLATTINIAMKRTRARRDMSLAVTTTPAGSDQHDMGSIIGWLNRIGRRNRVAVRQLRVLDATLAARLG